MVAASPAGGGTGELSVGLVERVARRGPLPFGDFVEAALYGPGGFFTSGGGAGRSADFLTSPEVGPLFGAVLARALDAEWARLGRPDAFVVVEAGAGRGALARSVLDAGAACRPALRWACVERSALLRARAAKAVAGLGVAVLAQLPAVRGPGVVVANELLDNLGFLLLERRAEGWAEVRVGASGGRLVEVLVDAPVELAGDAEVLAPGAALGARIPLQRTAVAWLRSALGVIERGRVIVVDTCATTPVLASRPWADWLRTYRGHQRGAHPLDRPGTQDVACDVAVDQLARERPPEADRPQSRWLRAHGLDELVAAARDTWRERAALGDLEALAARSRIGEADALCDPSGLGAFRVLEWEVG